MAWVATNAGLAVCRQASQGATDVCRTERKKTGSTLTERNLQLALAERAALVGTIGYDADSEKLQISAGYAALHGFPAPVREITRSQWKAGVRHDDLAWVEEL